MVSKMDQTMNILKRAVILTLAITVAACGGGGSSAGSSLYGGGTAAKATAASIVLDFGGVTSITNNGTDQVTATVTAKDANNVVLSDVPVSFTSNSGDIAVTSTGTNAEGKIVATIAAGSDKSNREITVTATSGDLRAVRTFRVTGAAVSSTLVPSVIAPNTTGTVQYVVNDASGNPLSDQPITVSGAGASSSGFTDSNGIYKFTYTSPASGSDFVVTAGVAGVTKSDTITLQSAGGGTKPNATPGSVISASVEVNPSVVTVNEPGSTTNQALVRALFVGANNATIENIRARFDLDGDANSVGGQFASGSTPVYSSAEGEAKTFYIPGSKASPTGGVTIRVCYGYSDADLAGNACPNFVTTTMTVASKAVSVSIGTDGELINLNNGLQLAQDFVVTVNDSAGRAKGGVDIVPSLDLLNYFKGQYSYSGSQWALPTSTTCFNEDRNRNGVLEVFEDDAALPYTAAQGGNGNGSLEPRKSDLLVTVNGAASGKTNSEGNVIVRITYARNAAGWLKYNLLASASGISGTEGRANWTDVLRVPLDDLKKEATPAFYKSPYGVEPGCQNPD